MLFILLFSVVSVHGEQLVDMSHPVDENSITWVGLKPFSKSQNFKGYTDRNYWYESYNVAFPEHISTHIDAPNHFAYKGSSVDDIPISDLVAPAVVIDMREKASQNDVAELSTDDVMEWLDQHGPLPDGVVVFVLTGWGEQYHNKTSYLGTDSSDASKLRFPGVSEGAAQLMASHHEAFGRRILGVGIDTASIDHGPSQDFKAHRALAAKNIYMLENVANIHLLPTTGAEVTVLPLKLAGGSGGPCRILARIPDSGAVGRSSSVLASLVIMLFPILILR
ncbi:isatin hydrolase-like [Hyalella azteca]|uniref:Isatin hydrolase-like n=1 Tax=Hyalella azteca TaxID=294128 RepID=A0A8B7PHK3_HYAAZ|nr:isatin hydrolase-like [Hyalella azteca]